MNKLTGMERHETSQLLKSGKVLPFRDQGWNLIFELKILNLFLQYI
jgi:hypothetical protein